MSPTIRLVIIGITALAAGACQERGSPQQGRVGTARVISLEQVATIRDEGGVILARPSWISEDPSGNFAVPDDSDRNVKIYDASGRHLRTLGRHGGGPGEFQALLAAQTYRDSVMAYDFMGGKITVFDPTGGYSRTLSASATGRRPPFFVRVVDDSLFLFVSPPGSRDLLALVRPDGSLVSTFFNQTRYFGSDAAVIQNTHVFADGANGIVFAALAGGDSVWAFDYRGRRLGAGVADPVQPLVTFRSLVEHHGGNLYTPDGTSIFHESRFIIGLVAMDSASVALQVAPFDTQHGTDVLSGGTLLIGTLEQSGTIHNVARSGVDAGLLGRDREGRALLLRYESADGDAYELLRLRLGEPVSSAGGQ